MNATHRLMTAEELPRYGHEPYQQELIAGILHEMEPPEESLDAGDVVPGWSMRVGELFG